MPPEEISAGFKRTFRWAFEAVVSASDTDEWKFVEHSDHETDSEIGIYVVEPPQAFSLHRVSTAHSDSTNFAILKILVIQVMMIFL